MDVKTEKAVFLPSVEGWESRLEKMTNVDRVYCGSESCQFKILHNAKALEKVAEARPLSLVLPVVVTNDFYQKLASLILKLSQICEDFELVINNFGFLEWTKEQHVDFPIVLGRMLCFYHTFLDRKSLTKEFDLQRFSYFLEHYGVRRLEVSAPPTGLNVVGKEFLSEVALSLYYPYFPITVSRNCVFRKPGDDVGTLCAYECKDTSLLLDHPVSEDPFYAVDNAYHLKNNITELEGANRLVQQIIGDFKEEDSPMCWHHLLTLDPELLG